MDTLTWMVPLALGMGFVGLIAFLWSMRNGQLEDLEGAAVRILVDTEDRPIKAEGADKKAKDDSDGQHY